MAVANITSALRSTIRDLQLNAIKSAIDAGSSGGTISLYSGIIPANADTGIGSTLLGTLTFSDPCGTVSGNVFTASVITKDSSADNTGTATWARIRDSSGATVMDIDVSLTGGGGSLQLNSVSIVAGGEISISSFTIHF